MADMAEGHGDYAASTAQGAPVIALPAAARALGASLAALAIEPVRAGEPAEAIARLAAPGASPPLILVDAPAAGEWLARLERVEPSRRGRTLVVAAADEADLAFLALERGASEVVAPDADPAELQAVLFGRAPGAAETGLSHQPSLADLSSEVARIARALDELARSAPPARAEPGADAPTAEAARIRAMIRARRARESFFPGDLFADPAWDILLDLMAAHIEGKPVSVSSLCIAAAVPATTALRWIRTLTDQGLLVRQPDPHDGRRVFVGLSDQAVEAMRAYLAQAARAGTVV
jgi:hypothetical protein